MMLVVMVSCLFVWVKIDVYVCFLGYEHMFECMYLSHCIQECVPRRGPASTKHIWNYFLQELSGNVTHPLAAMLEFCLMKYQYWMLAVHLSRMENGFLWPYLRNGAIFLGNSAICCLATRLGYNSFVCMLNRTDHNVGDPLLTYNLIFFSRYIFHISYISYISYHCP